MPTRHFLPCDRPLLPEVVDRLLPASGAGPLRMEHTWILAPTRQAGRRLRETLTRSWRERGGTALLGLEVHPPSFLLQPRPDMPAPAHLFDWLAVWREVLTDRDPDSLPALMPRRAEALDSTAALAFARRLQRLREELFEGGLDLTTVCEHPALESERQRWRELASLETEYRARLAEHRLVDPIDHKRETLDAFTLPEGVERLVLAAVPDPSPVILRRLESLDRDARIEVWIHADERDAPLFSEWGVPGPQWHTRAPGRGDDPEGWLECLADPGAAADRLRELLADAPEQPDLALGLLDPSLSRPLAMAMEAEGRALYDPRPVPLDRGPVVRLLQVLEDHRRRDDAESLRALWRQPELLKALRPEDPEGLLREWEIFASETFPESSRAVDRARPPEGLRTAWETLCAWTRCVSAREILRLLEDIHAGSTLSTSDPADRLALRRIQQVADVLQEAARREEAGRGPSPDLILEALARESVDPLRVEGTLTAEGWLELPYHPSPNLLLVGMQEGFVPPALPVDPFLPHSVREELGLRGDRDWLARDAHLFHTLLSSRNPGAVRVWVMKRDRDGSPLHPSRLLFHGSDETLLRRAELLFDDPPPPPPMPPPAPGLRLDPERIPSRTLDHLSVSRVNAYLACPTRFYFRHVLGLQTRDDTALEPDAAFFGTLLHRVLERIVPEGSCDLDLWTRRCEAALDALLAERFGAPDSMSLRVLRHAALSRLRVAGKVQIDLWDAGWEPIAFELSLERVCDGMPIKGKIDRLDRHPEKGFRIVDYKSADTPRPPAAIHLGPAREGRESLQVEVNGRTRQWTNLQLPLYRWLARSEFPESESLEVCYFLLPKSPDDTGPRGWDLEPDLAAEAERALAEVVRLVRADVWRPASPASPRDDFAPLLHHGGDWVP